MSKEEFEKLIDSTVTMEQYDLIEMVYTYHPLISETDGKQQIATLYKMCGIGIIKEMLPTAQKCEVYETKINHLKSELCNPQKEYEKYRNDINEL